MSPLQPEQLKLFMTGTELKGAITDSIDRAPAQSMDDMWKTKLRQSKRSGMGHGNDTYSSLKENGWQGPGPGLLHRVQFSPVSDWDTDHLSVDDAHHRIAAAADIEAKSRGRREFFIPTTNRNEWPSLKPKERLD